MLNFNYRQTLFGSPYRYSNDTKMTTQERKQLNKMEQNFISKAKTKNDTSLNGEVDINELEGKADKLDENDPYAGLTEEDAEQLKEMRQQYTNDIRQKKQDVYDKEFEQACNERNKEVDKIKAKCDKIAQIISSGKNFAKGDSRYLGKNNPSALASALMQRSLNEMFRKKDDEKPKKLTGKEDKNYDDLEFPELKFANGDLTASEKKGLPTAQSLPNYETDYATPQISASNITYTKSATYSKISSNGGCSLSIDISI